MAGFSPQVRALVYARADQRCELCGRYAYGGSVHHRRPRGMGGDKRPETNRASNAVLLCGSATTPGGCHTWVENNRTEAMTRGLLVSRDQSPAEIPVDLMIGRVLLGDYGEYVMVA